MNRDITDESTSPSINSSLRAEDLRRGGPGRLMRESCSEEAEKLAWKAANSLWATPSGPSGRGPPSHVLFHGEAP